MDKNKENKRTTGSEGENAAAEILKRNGYIILERNFRFGRFGEIDIIAKESEYICFVEVKSRSSFIFGQPSEAVNRKKMDNIIKLAQIYLKKHHLENSNIRFDIVEIIYKKQNRMFFVLQSNIIKNAFC
jgi:putative endonuclease